MSCGLFLGWCPAFSYSLFSIIYAFDFCGSNLRDSDYSSLKSDFQIALSLMPVLLRCKSIIFVMSLLSRMFVWVVFWPKTLHFVLNFHFFSFNYGG